MELHMMSDKTGVASVLAGLVPDPKELQQYHDCVAGIEQDYVER
jgi:hypothetical protein